MDSILRLFDEYLNLTTARLFVGFPEFVKNLFNNQDWLQALPPWLKYRSIIVGRIQAVLSYINDAQRNFVEIKDSL